jgi:hypothetical protein
LAAAKCDFERAERHDKKRRQKASFIKFFILRSYAVGKFDGSFVAAGKLTPEMKGVFERVNRLIDELDRRITILLALVHT